METPRALLVCKDATRRSTSLIDQMWDARPQRWESFRRQTVRIDVSLALVELLLVLPEAARVVALKSETRTCARWWNLKLVYDLFPQLVGGDALKAAPQDRGLEEFAEIQLFASDLGHFKVLDSEVFLKLNEFVFKLSALALLVLFVQKFQLFGQSYVRLVVHSLDVYQSINRFVTQILNSDY